MTDRLPLIFIPGLFGSMGEDIIPGTGKWDFGIAESIYKPFIENIQRIGYVPNENLFICFYDWRKNCIFSARKYLLDVISMAKVKSGSSKVNMICHSMGGLVARAYVQSDFYKRDVKNLILIGTPNAGSANAYFFWAGGELPYEKGIVTDIFEAILEGYLWIMEKLHGVNRLQAIRKFFAGIRDLLPSKQYGNYVFFRDRTGKMVFIPYSEMKLKNYYLDELNDRKDIINHRNIVVTVIAGTGQSTNKYLRVGYDNSKEGWEDGKIMDSIKSREGDRTVLVKSALEVPGDKYIFHDTHSGILQRSHFILDKKLNKLENLTRGGFKGFSHNKNYISLIVEGSGTPKLKGNKDFFAWSNLNKNLKTERTEYYIRNIGRFRWILIKGDSLKDLRIKYTSSKSENISYMLIKNGRIEKRNNIRIKNKDDINIL